MEERATAPGFVDTEQDRATLGNDGEVVVFNGTRDTINGCSDELNSSPLTSPAASVFSGVATLQEARGQRQLGPATPRPS